MNDLNAVLECFTCGFEISDGTVKDRDAAHQRHDGAHEASWRADIDDYPVITLDRQVAEFAATGTVTQFDCPPVASLWYAEVIYIGADGDTDYAYGYTNGDEPDARWLAPYGAEVLETTVKPTRNNPAYVEPCACEDGSPHTCEPDDESECEGHESTYGAHMGESVYCDGSCRS